MRHFTLTLTVAEDALGETITAVTPLIVAQRVVMGPIAPLVEPEPAPEPRKKKERRETPVAETRLGKIVLELLKTGPCTVEEIAEHLREHRFASTSVSPVTSKLVAEGLVDRYTTSMNGRTTRAYRLVARA